MPNAASKSLPALDYVSIVASLYKDRRAMLVGMAATVLAVLIVAAKTGSALTYVHALAFMLITAQRYFNMVAFSRNRPGEDDVAAARYWERQAMVLGGVTSLLYGSWCFVSLVVVDDPFAELVSVSVTIAAMIGIVTRNFGIDRLVTVQSLVSAGPLAAGLVLAGDFYHIFLAALLAPTIISFRFLAADARGMLLAAVHERVAASMLADQLDTALETMQHGLCMLDDEGVIALANDRARQTFAGIAEGNWLGRPFTDLLDEAMAKRALPRETAERLSRTIGGKSGGKIIMKLSGDYHCEVTVSSRGERTVLLFENVTDRVRAQERINFMARYDALTGLPNRAHFTERVEAELARRNQAEEIEPAMLAMIDLDDFKHVNDTLGHLAGDKVLAEAARRILSVMHPQSQLARIGGDEFVVFRTQDTACSTVQAEAGAILDALGKPFVILGEKLSLRASIGFVGHKDRDIVLDDLITRADLALYRAKDLGKGRYQAFVEEMDSAFRYRQRLKADLAEAIASNQLQLVYQPLVDIRTRRVAGCEALARWMHPELGAIATDVFIPLAEDIGLVSEITRWVLATATAECARWPEPLFVSVNVSARDLWSDTLAAHISDALEKSGLDARRLEIEVTETALIEERQAAAERLGALGARGIGIALDDFGTGYSSLSYLHEMPFTKLKIDRSFIVDIAVSARALKLTANVARLGSDLGLSVVAEGIETAEQLAVIAQETGVDLAQGYLFGLPLPAGEICDLIGTMNGAPKPGKAARSSLHRAK